MRQLRHGNKDKTTWKPCCNDRVCADHLGSEKCGGCIIRTY